MEMESVWSEKIGCTLQKLFLRRSYLKSSLTGFEYGLDYVVLTMQGC